MFAAAIWQVRVAHQENSDQEDLVEETTHRLLCSIATTRYRTKNVLKSEMPLDRSTVHFCPVFMLLRACKVVWSHNIRCVNYKRSEPLLV